MMSSQHLLNRVNQKQHKVSMSVYSALKYYTTAAPSTIVINQFEGLNNIRQTSSLNLAITLIGSMEQPPICISHTKFTIFGGDG